MARVKAVVKPFSVQHRPKESQSKYWEKFGVGQSAGSMYEAGKRSAPMSLAILVELYSSGVIGEEDLSRAKTKVEARRGRRKVKM